MRTHSIRLEVRDRRTPPFAWAVVPADVIAELAQASALPVLEQVEHRGRWIAELVKVETR